MTVRWLTPEAFAAHQARRRTLPVATLLGYAVLRYGPHQIGDCMRDLRRIFA
jgi:hypothetical protein